MVLMKANNEIDAMIKKNFGQINLKKTLASLTLIILFTAGAIKADWNKITAIIAAEHMTGIFFNIFLFLLTALSIYIIAKVTSNSMSSRINLFPRFSKKLPEP